MSAGAAPNIISVQGQDYILARVGAYATHLVAKAGDGAPCRPIVDHDRQLNPAYEATALKSQTWSLRTLCGRDQWFMAPTELGTAFKSIWNGQEPAELVPTCKRCLRILDSQFATPKPHERLACNVARAVEELEQSGGFHVLGLPADQAELFRKGVRAEARKRGWSVRTTAFDGQMIGYSENSMSPQRREVVTRDAMQRMVSIATGETQPPPSWRFEWS